MKNCRIENLNESGQHIAGRILADVFIDDPLIKALFCHVTRQPETKSFFDFMIYESIKLKRWMIGVYAERRLAGIAIIDTPKSRPRWWMVLKIVYILRSLIYLFGLSHTSANLMQKYYRITLKARPKAPHYYLFSMGVDPIYQNKGYAKAMMNRIHAAVDQDKRVNGIGLDTVNPDNVEFYKKFGYEVISKQELDNMSIYIMFRYKS